MTKKTRTILFFLLAVFFLVAATTVIFYAQGIRFDLKNFRILKTGGISVKVSPVNAKVFLNQKMAGQTTPISDYVFIQGLLPKTYEVKVEKEGYMPWSKTLEVKGTEVTEAKSVVLFPQTIQFSGEKFNVEKILPLSGEKLILQYQPTDGVPKISVYDLARKEETGVASLNLLLNDNNLLSLETLGTQGLVALLENKKTKKTAYYYADLQSQSPAAQKLDFMGGNAEDINLVSSFGDKIIFWREDGVIFKKILGQSAAAQKFSEEKTASFTLSGGYFYILSEDGNLSKIDQNKSLQSQALTSRPVEIKNNDELVISIFGGQVFLRDGKDLYTLNEKEKTFEKMFEGVENLKVSPFGGKLLCQLQNELWVYTLEDIEAPFREIAGTKIFISRFSQPIEKSDWIDDNYFAFSSDGKIKISETDNRSNINMYEIAGFESSDIWFGQRDKSLYILSKGTLLVSDKLLSR